MIQVRTIKQVSRYFGVIQHGMQGTGRKLRPDRGPLIVADEIPTTSKLPNIDDHSKEKAPVFVSDAAFFFSLELGWLRMRKG